MIVQKLPIYHIDQIRNKDTLNIFSDASTRRGPFFTTAACYGAVAVCKDTIIEKIYRIHSDTTSNAEELRGLRGSVRLAIKYANDYKYINLFTDSLITVNDLRNFNKFKYDSNSYTIYKDARHKNPVANQSLVIEIAQLLIQLHLKNPDLIVNLYHQKGHVSYDNFTNLDYAAERFKSLNKIKKQIDLNLTRYISIYNSLVDHESRTILMKTNVFNDIYKDPIKFFAIKKIII